MTNTEKEMLHYVRSSLLERLLLTPFGIGISVFFLYLASMALRDLSNASNIVCLIFALLGLLLFGSAAFAPFTMYRAMIKFLKRNNIYDEAISDFSTAASFSNDSIRLGNKFVFGKKCCTVLRYTDICRVYQYIRKVNFIERNRWLKAVDKDGETWTLCKLDIHLPLNTKNNTIADKQLLDILNFLLYKNNSIAIGYK